MQKAPASVDAYLAGLPDDQRTTLEEVRRTIRDTAPDAVEGIAYAMPSYKYRGKPLVYFAASKNHCGLYGPAVVEHQELLNGYDTSKGTVRFPNNRPLPKRVVSALVKARMAAIEAEMDSNRPRRGRTAGVSRARRASG